MWSKPPTFSDALGFVKCVLGRNTAFSKSPLGRRYAKQSSQASTQIRAKATLDLMLDIFQKHLKDLIVGIPVYFSISYFSKYVKITTQTNRKWTIFILSNLYVLDIWLLSKKNQKKNVNFRF